MGDSGRSDMDNDAALSRARRGRLGTAVAQCRRAVGNAVGRCRRDVRITLVVVVAASLGLVPMLMSHPARGTTGSGFCGSLFVNPFTPEPVPVLPGGSLDVYMADAGCLPP